MAAAAILRPTYPVVGLFDTTGAAERAYISCLDRGYDLGQINVVVSEGTRRKLLISDNEIKAELGGREAEGGELGGPKGGRVGILVTVLASVGAAVALPAIGFVVGLDYQDPASFEQAASIRSACGTAKISSRWSISRYRFRSVRSTHRFRSSVVRPITSSRE